jgi:hypothetical protein
MYSDETREFPRAVTVQRTRQITFIKASCNVRGALCFVRSTAGGWRAQLIRVFRLIPPESFSDDIAVFGLHGTKLDALRNDDEFNRAIHALVEMGVRLSLQGNKLVATVRNRKAGDSRQALSFYVGAAAERIEKLLGDSVNDDIGADRLGWPYGIYAILSGAILVLCFALVEASLAPLIIALYSLALGSALAAVWVAVVLPMHLRKHALGGAVVVTATIASIAGSLLLGSSLTIMANTYVGERLLSARDIHVMGTVVVRHIKYTHCWLYLDHPSQDFVQGESFRRLPLQCGEVHYQGNPTPRLYDVKLNPGLLGAPFVQSIEAEDGG